MILMYLGIIDVLNILTLVEVDSQNSDEVSNSHGAGDNVSCWKVIDIEATRCNHCNYHYPRYLLKRKGG